MPQARQHQSVHFFNDRVYIVGGITSVGDAGILDTAYSAPVSCDGTLGSWRQEATLPTRLWYHNSVLVNGNIYLFGGRSGYFGGVLFDILQGTIEGDGTILQWTDIGDVPGDRSLGMGTVYVPWVDQVYLIGGADAATDAIWMTGLPCAGDEQCEDGDRCTNHNCTAGLCEACPYITGDVDKNCFVTLADIFCVLDAFAGDDNCSSCPAP